MGRSREEIGRWRSKILHQIFGSIFESEGHFRQYTEKRKLIVLGIISCTTGERRCGCASRASSASPLLTGRCPSSSASLASSPSDRPPATPQWTEPCPSSSRVSCSWSLSSPTGPMPCAADDELDTEAFVWLVAVLDGEGKLLAPWCRLPYRRRGLRLQNIQR